MGFPQIIHQRLTYVRTITYMKDATVIVQKRPAAASAMKAPIKGVRLAVPPKLESVFAALGSGMWSCLVR